MLKFSAALDSVTFKRSLVMLLLSIFFAQNKVGLRYKFGHDMFSVTPREDRIYTSIKHEAMEGNLDYFHECVIVQMMKPRGHRIFLMEFI